MEKTAAAACLSLGASLLLNAASPGACPQDSLKASTNEQFLERIEAEVAFAKGLAGPTPADFVASEVKKAESGDDLVVRRYETEVTKRTARVKGNGFTVEMPAYGIATVRVTSERAGA